MSTSFFLGSGEAARYGLYTPPAGTCRGAFLYVAPFAEEMNKSRRMAALQAARLAQAGYAVLQLDLYGTGDSAGDFADARWEIWREDLARGDQWLRQQLGDQLPQAPGVWGLRLGALLALDYARQAAQPPSALLLWQPVSNGNAFLTQFLRLKVAGAMLQDGAQPATTNALRAALAAGEALEIAGYTLAPELAAAIDAAEASRLVPPCPVHWLEVAATPAQPLSPVGKRILDGWREQGVDVNHAVAAGVPFWATQEIGTSPALLDATVYALTVACHA